jgi:hypothetical protein
MINGCTPNTVIRELDSNNPNRPGIITGVLILSPSRSVPVSMKFCPETGERDRPEPRKLTAVLSNTVVSISLKLPPLMVTNDELKSNILSALGNDPPEIELVVLPLVSIKADAPLAPDATPPWNMPPVIESVLEAAGVCGGQKKVSPFEARPATAPPVSVPPDMVTLLFSAKTPSPGRPDPVGPAIVPPEIFRVDPPEVSIPGLGEAPWMAAPLTTFSVVALLTIMSALGPLTVCVPPSL